MLSKLFRTSLSMPIIYLLFFSAFLTLNAEEGCIVYDHDHKHGISKNSPDDLANNLYTDSTLSDSGLFIVYWNSDIVTRVNAQDNSIDTINFVPPLDDFDLNGTPDFIDSVGYYLDYAYTKQCEELGFASPMIIPDPDSGILDTVPYMVFIKDIGSTYGFVTERNDLPEGSFMTIDNDFKGSGMKSKGFDGIKVATMHEFHHSVQLVNYLPEENLYPHQSIKYSELSATYLEQRFFPELRDYFQYLLGDNYSSTSYLNLWDSFISFEPRTVDDRYGYANFFTMLYKVYGDEFFIKYYEKLSLPDLGISSKTGDLKALDIVMRELGSDIEREVERYWQWVYRATTGAADGETFDEAEYYPKMGWALEDVITTTGQYQTVYEVFPFGIKFTRFIVEGSTDETNDTLDIVHWNIDTIKTYTAGYDNPMTYRLSISENREFDESAPVLNDKYYVNFSELTQYDRYAILEKKGSSTFISEDAFPMPFDPRIHNNLYLPVGEKTALFSSVDVEIMDISQNIVYRGEGDVEAVSFNENNSHKAVQLFSSDLSDLNVGVYIYRVILADGSSIIGKIAVI
jgi:hypothetical protein